jgi:hypothetical protein
MLCFILKTARRVSLVPIFTILSPVHATPIADRGAALASSKADTVKALPAGLPATGLSLPTALGQVFAGYSLGYERGRLRGTK